MTREVKTRCTSLFHKKISSNCIERVQPLAFVKAKTNVGFIDLTRNYC